MALVRSAPPPVLLGSTSKQYSSDLCIWKEGGLTWKSHSKEVEQVYLLYSTGFVESMYSTGTLTVNIQPNTASPARNLTVH